MLLNPPRPDAFMESGRRDGETSMRPEILHSVRGHVVECNRLAELRNHRWVLPGAEVIFVFLGMAGSKKSDFEIINDDFLNFFLSR